MKEIKKDSAKTQNDSFGKKNNVERKKRVTSKLTRDTKEKKKAKEKLNMEFSNDDTT